MSKGWVDRVWNNGWAYGERKLGPRKALLIGAAATSAEHNTRRSYDSAMRRQLLTGIIDYCDIEQGAQDDSAPRQALLLRARGMGRSF